MNHRLHIAAVLLLLRFSTVHAQPVQEKFYSRSQLLNDLHFIRNTLKGLHPCVDRFHQEKAFDDAYETACAAVRNADSLSGKSFFRIVNPYVAKLRCGHIKFMPPAKDFPFFYHANNVLPCIVRFDESGSLLILNAVNSELKGHYLTEIDGKPIEAVLGELKLQMLADGYIESSVYAQIEQYFSAWYADFIQESASFQVTASNETGEKKSWKLDGISASEWQQLHASSGNLTKNNVLKILNDSVAYLKIPVFYSSKGNRHFVNFLDSAFTAVRLKNTPNLIIDLRDNEGGNDRLGKELYARIALKNFKYYDRIEVKVKSKKQAPYYKQAYFPRFIGLAKFFIKEGKDGKLLFKKHQNLGLHKPAKNAFAGKVYFLANGLSCSVTSEFLAVAKSENRGIFAGAESGGAYEGNNSGTFAIYKLPATGIDLGVPVAAYYSAVVPPEKSGRGIIPDIVVSPTKSDLLNSRDSAMEIVLQSIRNPEK